MCNFVPGECLALARTGEIDLHRRLTNWNLPGRITVLPLLAGEGPVELPSAQPFRDYHFVHLTDVPEGLEVLAVSKLSAALADLIGAHQAVVELNLYQPLAAQAARRRMPELSKVARRSAAQLRRVMERDFDPSEIARPIALLDSGLQLSALPVGRRITARDYSGGRATFGQLLHEDHDHHGHGTQVVRILDNALPERVPIVSGRVMRQLDVEITVMRVASAFAHLVASEDPAVVNLSLAPRDDDLICPHCGQVVPVEAFHSLILPHVIRLASARTLTVMAAGNRGRLSNACHALAAADTLALVEADDADGRVAAYSNRVDSEFASVARHFGGDAEARSDGGPIFDGVPGTYGTSFAAPFVAAAAYAYQVQHGPGARFAGPAAGVLDFGAYCEQQLQVPIPFQPSSVAATGAAGATASHWRAASRQ